MPPATPATRPPGTRPYFPELDGVRAIAALMVMHFHYTQQSPPHSDFAVVGQTGVDLFFILSGFLITTILLQHQHGDWDEIRKFYIRRTLRIFPLYYGFLALLVLLGEKVSWWFWVYLQNFASTFGALPQGPGHFWSLGVEEQFYLVWPFLILFWPRRWLVGAMAGAVLLSIALRIAVIGTHVDVFMFPLTRLDGLAGGGLLAYAYYAGALRRLRPLLAGLIVVCLLALAGEWKLAHTHPFAWSEVVKYAASAGLYAGVVGLLISSADTPLHRLLSSRPLRAIGTVSYGMYVFHPLIIERLVPVLDRVPVLGKLHRLEELVTFAVVYAVAWLSFNLFEKRFTRLKSRFAPEKRFAVVAA